MKNPPRLALNQETLRNLTNDDQSARGLAKTLASPCTGVKSVCFPVCTPAAGIH